MWNLSVFIRDENSIQLSAFEEEFLVCEKRPVSVELSFLLETIGVNGSFLGRTVKNFDKSPDFVTIFERAVEARRLANIDSFGESIHGDTIF